MSFGVAPGAVGSRRPQPFSSYSNSNVVQSQTSKIGRSLTAVKRRLLEAQQNGIAMRDQMRKELRGLKDVHDQIVTEISRSRRPKAVDAESLQATRRNSKKSSTTGAPTSSTSTAAGASAGGGALAPASSTSSGAFDNYGNFFRPASRTTASATVTSENIVSNLLITEAYHKDLEASLEQDPVRTLTRPAAAVGKDVISGGAGAGAVAADENQEEVLEEQPGASSTSTTAAQRRIHHPQLAGLRASLMKRHEEELAAERALDSSAAGDSEDDGGGNASHPLVAGQRQRPAFQRKLSIDKKPTLSRRMKVNDGTTTPQKQGTSSSRGASRERRPSNVSSSVLSDGFGSERKTSGPHTAAAVRKHKQDLGGMIRDFRTNLVNFRGDGGGATGSTTGASHYLKSTTQTEHRKVAPRDLSHLQKQPHHEHMIDLRAHFHSSEIHPADRRHPDRLVASRGAAPRGGGGGGRGERGGMSSGPGSGGGGAGPGTAAPLLPDSNSGTLMASPLVESLRGVRRMREQLTEHTSSQKNAVSQLEESFREYFLGPEMEKMNQAFHNAESEYTEELQKIKQQKDLVVNWFMRKELEQGQSTSGEGLATQGGEYQDILRRLAVLRGEVTSLGKSMKVVDSKKLASDLEADEAELLKIVEGLGAESSTSPGAVPVPAVAGTTTRTTTSTPSSALARSHFDVAGELESLKQQMTQFFSSGKGKQNYEYYEPELDAIRGELDSLRAEMRASGVDGVAPKSSAVPSPASAIGRNSVATAVGGGDEGQESLLGGRRPSQQTASAPPPAPPPDPLFYPELVSEQSSKESQIYLRQSMAPGRAAATSKIVMPAASSAVVEPQRVDAVGESEDRRRPVRRRGQAQTRTLMQDETQTSQCATREHSQHELTTSDGAVHLDDGALLAHAPGHVRWFDKGVGKGGLMQRRGGTGTGAGRNGVARDEDGKNISSAEGAQHTPAALRPPPNHVHPPGEHTTLTTGTSTGAGAGAGPLGRDFKSSPASGLAVEYSQLFHHDTHGRGPPSFGAPPHHQPAPLQPATTAPLLSAFESMAQKQPQRRISPPPHSKRIR